MPGIVEAPGVDAERADVSQTELERAVGEILIDEETLAARVAELGE